MNYKVVLRKQNTLKEVSEQVTASSQKQAIAEAKQMFQWRYGYFPNELSVVSVEEVVERLIHVLPMSKRGKQLIKRHGDFWLAITKPKRMQCFDSEVGIRIRSTDGCDYRRNIRLDGDNVFLWDYVDSDEIRGDLNVV